MIKTYVAPIAVAVVGLVIGIGMWQAALVRAARATELGMDDVLGLKASDSAIIVFGGGGIALGIAIIVLAFFLYRMEAPRAIRS